MREIKFRAWDKNERKMIKPPVELKQLLRQVSDRNDNSLGGDAIRRHDLDWMQFAGLHDCNGTEIYEGDVIEMTIEPWPFNRDNFGISEPVRKRARIDWDEYSACFTETFDPWLRMRPCYQHLRLVDSDAEVIGNIYEHPELLEKESMTEVLGANTSG
jgi:uncharacterized phage protein (TIGR01671 family)